MSAELYAARYQRLNEQQKKVVDTLVGPVLVVAGPGSGKTEILALRVANIIRTQKVKPHAILCVTFTESGAHAMRTRLQTLIGNDAFRVSIFTFHGLCTHIISRYPEYFYNAATYTPLTDVMRAEIIHGIFKALPHHHPFASFHPEEGFVYVRDALDRISSLKKAGFTASAYESVVKTLQEEYSLVEQAVSKWPDGRLSIKKIKDVEYVVDQLENTKTTTGIALAVSLKKACVQATEEGSVEAISAWKRAYCVVSENDTMTLKESTQKDKVQALCDIYTSYAKALYEQGVYDYDDMILDVLSAIKNNELLRSELEEQYEYILIDEFQDTNDAQMNIIRSITSHPVHEERPNVCVVGDDDQAIYKFQGAEVSHMMHFRNALYRDVQTIVLDTNYRSTEDVLLYARDVIVQGSVRLEKMYADISKKMKAGNTALTKGTITIQEYASESEEYNSVAKAIKSALDTGTEPKEIAVIGRNHKELQNFIPYLDAVSVPYTYKKQANVFDEKHIKELLTLCEFATHFEKETGVQTHALPHILAFPFWEIDRAVIFDIALRAIREHMSWLEILKTHEDPKCKKVYDALVMLSVDGLHTPLEQMLQRIIEETPFKSFYFSADILKKNPQKYIQFLSSLKTLLDALREYKQGEILHIHDVPQFIQTYTAYNIPLTYESSQGNNQTVQIMTAHGSKGLEFEHVYIIHAHDSVWTKKPIANKIPVPSAIKPLVAKAGETEDDYIRLLYVAMTRAKHTLSISGSDPLIRYVEDKKIKAEAVPVSAQVYSQALFQNVTYTQNEKNILQSLVDTYVMPVTHFHNFLNVIDGGPMYFIEQNLLRFPQPMNPSSAYGSAVHKAIETYITYPMYHGGELAPREHILATFDATLTKARLSPSDHVFMRQKGHDVITAYMEELEKENIQNMQAEVDLRNENCLVGNARITGKLDVLSTNNNTYTLIDFKTGKPFFGSDKALSPYEAYKSHIYRQQLLYYKILLAESHSFKLPVAKSEIRFVERDKSGEYITFIMEENPDGIARTRTLIEKVYAKIKNLDFPSIEKYEKTLDGVIAFENDLLEDTI